MDTEPIHPDFTLSQILLTFRKKRKATPIRRMCDSCLINICERCEDPKCSCICRDEECNLAA